MWADGQRHREGPRKPTNRRKRFLTREAAMLRYDAAPPVQQVWPACARGMTDDSGRFKAQSVAGLCCPKGPVHVLRNAGAEPANRGEDAAPHPHVAAACVTLDKDVAFKIE